MSISRKTAIRIINQLNDVTHKASYSENGRLSNHAEAAQGERCFFQLNIYKRCDAILTGHVITLVNILSCTHLQHRNTDIASSKFTLLNK